MSRKCIPFSAGDVSALARSLRSQLTTVARIPSHLELLNLLARDAGLWVLWSRLPAREQLTEEQLNRHLRANHLFSDHALLRRYLKQTTRGRRS
jgi:hypothetical protein